MLDNINLMDNLNAKWNKEQVNIIFDRFHVVFLNWIPGLTILITVVSFHFVGLR